MTKAEDKEFRDEIISKVEDSLKGWLIKMSDGWSFYVPDNGVEPHVGDPVRLYSRGIGYRVRGLDIRGLEVYYRTPEEQQELDRQEVERINTEKKERFEQQRELMDQIYNSLPVEFQQRLDGFRERNPDFRWDLEPYEMMCCVDAVKIAKACLLPETGTLLRSKGIKVKDTEWEDNPIGRLNAFAAINSAVNNYQYDLQREIVPDLDEGHSGNSFGAALQLAYLYISSPELVAKQHGALCPMVGCVAYGCFAATAGA